MPSPEPAVHYLALPENLTMRSAAEIKSLLLDSLGRHAATELDVAERAPVDLSFVQIVEAARISFASAEKGLRLAKPASGTLLSVLERGGIIDTMNINDRQFWLHQGETQ
ncbi:hypothetical protein ABID21_002989 [Pseudorhizobium tarimense]|uniref:MlaB-like STAS domain-containing protein n=1 Tax=Pseudorhizobium tarimense TaxID=1079109 RepID=A0ABV2H9I7_9HYPH|nr:STAS domain-containing protein [Pseudorhizobium tarimense]MCJ8519995.1 STAS domain-containing protein [Pseudorhizobium tarimense]